MINYTFLAILSVVIIVVIDTLILKTKLILFRKFWIFQLICFVLQFFLDGFLTWRPIYIVNPTQIIGLYIFTIPLENFIFGFSLLSLTVIIFEYLLIQKSKASI